MFVDYENLYSVLTSQSSRNKKTSDYATEILDEVARYLEEGDDTPTIYGRAYGPFDVLHDTEDADVPSTLHSLGVEPVYVASAMQGNTSEIRLTVEVTRFLKERSDVQTIVIVTGDRPYLPLVRTIRELGGRALVAAVNPPQTEAYAENDLYLDARNLLSQNSREDLLANAPEDSQNYDQSRGGAAPQRYERLDNPVARRTIAITEEHFGQYEEVYLTPLLRKLSDVLGADHDPKALVSELEAAGAVRLEKRNGYPYDYTVLIMNDGHPDVEEVREEVANSGGDAYTDTPSGDGSVSYDEDEDEASYHEYDEYAMDEAIASDTDAPDPNESLATAEQADEGDDSDAPDDAEESS
jgi:uncharacterized LabA/DUF88 family protein